MKPYVKTTGNLQKRDMVLVADASKAEKSPTLRSSNLLRDSRTQCTNAQRLLRETPGDEHDGPPNPDQGKKEHPPTTLEDSPITPPSNRDHKALNRGRSGVLAMLQRFGVCF